jgi:prolyl-tRNA synthetase
MVAKEQHTAISPTREADYAEWYQQVVRASELAENSPVRGCMVIKPWGYQLWDNIKNALDRMFKDTGHVNAYFPLFIPLSFLEREAEHVEGFAKECAVVTHHRLEMGSNGGLVPAGPLDEPLVIRPTSETIIGATFSKWVQSYRDLPLLINQWANVVRWEMRTRLFLRTSEFLWQEGHTAHETRDEAWEETLKILEIYKTFVQDFMAVPVICGEKTASERFPGAVNTFCIEAMMQDRKALQAGTSHFLGQNFARASQIKYQSEEGREEYAWTTSWGVSTRLIGCMVMVHGDDDGMVMPPRLSPSHVVLMPIIRRAADRQNILAYCKALAQDIRQQSYHDRPIEAVIDDRDMNAGEKGWDWIKKGIPIRVEVGTRDIEKNAVFVARRDREPRDKFSQARGEFVQKIPELLEEIQSTLFSRAERFLNEYTRSIDDYEEFARFFSPQNSEKPEIHGGFVLSHWCGDSQCEDKIKSELSVTIRCIPLDGDSGESGRCVVFGKLHQS